MSSNEKLIVLDDVCKHFKVSGGMLKAVDHISLDIYKGETLGLVGESGCGKSTLGRVAMGIYPATSGKLYYAGEELNLKNAATRFKYAKKAQIIFQDPYASLDPRMTVSSIIEEGMVIHGMYDAKRRQERVYELLELVGLNKEHANRFPHEFSGGQRQRIGIARALAIEPEFIVCDEPISALDVSIQSQIINLLHDLQQQLGLTFLFIAHDLNIVKYISDRIAVMKDGVIQHVGTPRDIYQRPKNVFVATFIGRTNIVNAHVKDGIITFADGYHEHIDALDKAAEQDVRCSIRPEEFIICKDGTDGIHGTVQECTYLGLNTHYTIDTDQGDSVEIVEESSIGEGLKKGEKVLLKVKKEKINVFTKDGGTNLIRSDAYEKQ